MAERLKRAGLEERVKGALAKGGVADITTTGRRNWLANLDDPAGAGFATTQGYGQMKLGPMSKRWSA